MWLTLAIFCCFQFVYMTYIHFVEINNMEKATEVDDLEKIDEDKSRKIERDEREREGARCNKESV